MNYILPNSIVAGEVVSADASGGVAITLFKAGVAYVLQPTERLHITDFQLVTTAGGECYLYADGDGDGVLDAGELIGGGNFPPNGGESTRFGVPHICKPGVVPKLVAPAGTVKLVLHAYVR